MGVPAGTPVHGSDLGAVDAPNPLKIDERLIESDVFGLLTSNTMWFFA
jgi:hypothetical protein